MLRLRTLVGSPLLMPLLAATLTGCAATTATPPVSSSIGARAPGGPSPVAPGTADAVDARYRSEAERLGQDARVQRAFRAVEALEERTQRDLIRLNEIPAPPFMEKERAQAYLALLKEAGVDTAYIDAEGNAIGVRRGRTGGKTLVLSGHLDTVFPEGTDVTVRMRGDTLYAPGIGDDTRGLMVVLTALRAMNEAGIRTEGDIWFVGTVGEEGLGDLRGVKHLFREGGERIDAFISIDGGEDGRIANEGLGSRRYRVTFQGPGGHSWGAFGLANPTHALGRAIRIFDEKAASLVATGPRTSYNVGRIGGGTSVNSIPFEAWMEVDMRSLDQASLLRIDSALRASMAEALAEQNAIRSRGEPLKLEIALVGDRPSGTTAPATPLVQRAMAAAAQFGAKPSVGSGSTDSNIPIALGIPAVTVGRGGAGGGSHALDEWWLNQNGHIAIQRTLLLAIAEAGLAPE